MTTYTVKQGDSLSIIAGKLWGDITKWPLLQSANNIKDPALIYPGQSLIVPAFANTQVAVGAQATTPNNPTTTKADSGALQAQTATGASNQPPTSTSINKLWYWAGGGVLAAIIVAAVVKNKKKKAKAA